MSKHTPGPWELEENDDATRAVVRDAECEYLTRIELTRYADDRRDPEAEANARLIAAAPELLKELRLLNLDANGEQRKDTPAWRAIAKAEAA